MATLLAGMLPVAACTKDFDNSTVDSFDLSRYLGEWYEIARFDHSFERGMDNTMAQYILQDDGKVIVLNTDGRTASSSLLRERRSTRIRKAILVICVCRFSCSSTRTTTL